jgi:AraC-like DNA-binding protein
VSLSEWIEDRRVLPGGASVWSRGRRNHLADGLWWLEQEVRYGGHQAGPFAMGPGWIIEFIELTRGTFAFRCGVDALPVPWRRFVLVLTPFSVVRLESRDAEFRFVALAGECGSAHITVSSAAVGSQVFPLRGRLPAGPEEAGRRIAALGQGVVVEISRDFPPFVRRAKRWIERHYHERASIAALARTLGVSAAHLAREFRRALGMSPLNYLHYLRSSEATARLAAGKGIVDTSLDVGYGDLSSLYRHFRKLGCQPPGRYRARERGARST